LLIAAVISTFAGLSVATPPFTPIVPQPDYRSTMVEKSRGQADVSRIVTHHRTWTRVDRASSSEYYSATSAAKATVLGERSITLERRIGVAPGIDFDARNTASGRPISAKAAPCGINGGPGNRCTVPMSRI
jgi:hypothetical protein